MMREARGYKHNQFKIEMGKRALARALTRVPRHGQAHSRPVDHTRQTAVKTTNLELTFLSGCHVDGPVPV